MNEIAHIKRFNIIPSVYFLRVSLSSGNSFLYNLFTLFTEKQNSVKSNVSIEHCIIKQYTPVIPCEKECY